MVSVLYVRRNGPSKTGVYRASRAIIPPQVHGVISNFVSGHFGLERIFGTIAKSLCESALNTLTGRGHMVVASEKTNGHNSVVCKAIHLKFGLLLGL